MIQLVKNLLGVLKAKITKQRGVKVHLG